MENNKTISIDKAVEIQKELERTCKRHGIWCIIEYDNRPDLRFINMQIKIKVD